MFLGLAGVLALAVGVAYLSLVVLPARDIAARIPAVDLGSSERSVQSAVEGAIRALREDGESAISWADLAQVLHAHELFAPALACYQEAMALAPDDYRWPYLAALAQMKLDLPSAQTLFEAAAALDPPASAFYVAFGDLLLQLDRQAGAEQRYRQALERDAESSHAHYGLARIAFTRGDLEKALEQLKRAIAAAPRYGEAHRLMAQVDARLGDTAAAERSESLARGGTTGSRPYDPVVARMEGKAVSSTAHARRGSALARQGDFAAAEVEFRKVLAIRPGSPRDYSNLGGVLASQGHLEEAVAQFREGLDLAPNDVDLLNNLGMTLADAGEPDSGIELLQRAVSLDPSFWQAHQNLGLVRERQGRLDAALQHYGEALRLNPADPTIHTSLGTALAKQADLGGAVEAWSAALELDPGSLEPRYNIGIALISLGRHAEAMGHLRKGVRLAPRSSRFLSLLAWQLATSPDNTLRDGSEALQLARLLFDADAGNPERADLLAAALAENGRFEEAVALLEQTLRRMPAGQPLTTGLRQRMALYRQGVAFRQP